MAHITLTFSEQTIARMHDHYKASIDKSPQGAIFRARTNAAVITAYKSGKVLFQGNNPELEANKWSNGTNVAKGNPTNTTKQPTSKFYPSTTLFESNHIGSDESGTGDYFGPVTTCAVYVTNEQIHLLKELGIQDSKKIQDSKIIELSKELVHMSIPYSLLVLHNEKYNQLQQKGWSQGKMKAMLHHHVHKNILKKIGDAPYDGILVDQFCQPAIYIRHLASEQEKLPNKTYFMTKAESYSIAVAAGSVIARASFLKEMDLLSEKVGYNLLKGASKKVDQLIAQIIQDKGEQTLHSIAKVHFANTNKAREYI